MDGWDWRQKASSKQASEGLDSRLAKQNREPSINYVCNDMVGVEEVANFSGTSTDR